MALLEPSSEKERGGGCTTSHGRLHAHNEIYLLKNNAPALKQALHDVLCTNQPSGRRGGAASERGCARPRREGPERHKLDLPGHEVGGADARSWVSNRDAQAPRESAAQHTQAETVCCSHAAKPPAQLWLLKISGAGLCRRTFSLHGAPSSPHKRGWRPLFSQRACLVRKRGRSGGFRDGPRRRPRSEHVTSVDPWPTGGGLAHDCGGTRCAFGASVPTTDTGLAHFESNPCGAGAAARTLAPGCKCDHAQGPQC